MTAKPDMAVFTVAIQTEKLKQIRRKTVDTVVTQFISVLNKQGVKGKISKVVIYNYRLSTLTLKMKTNIKWPSSGALYYGDR